MKNMPSSSSGPGGPGGPASKGQGSTGIGVLPIDEHRENIIKTIQNHRVTIIHGETGCGKSSRVPIYILASNPQYKLFISQPRRIAAKSLIERVRATCHYETTATTTNGHGSNHHDIGNDEPLLSPDMFALRMGHGYKEYENVDANRAWFVTTGYLTRLLANHVERFDNISHLIIDEIHERNVDTDILCWLCKNLLQTNPHIRLVLMSATLATSLYQTYFTTRTIKSPPIIHVGVKRFGIREYFVEDLLSSPPFNFDGCWTNNEIQHIQSIQNECEVYKCQSAPTSFNMIKRFKLVAKLVTLIGQPKSNVLIFVPGMNEIIAITELLEEYNANDTNNPKTEYVVFPIHSDIPFEDQMAAFNEDDGEEEYNEEHDNFIYDNSDINDITKLNMLIPTTNKVKVIIATNAAESSVTLPNVDHVICLGLCRQIIYNEASHRQMLVPQWISQASSKQRAGRTGRIRPGYVYRLYTRNAFLCYMEEYDIGEMKRIPLDQVILSIKEMLTTTTTTNTTTSTTDGSQDDDGHPKTTTRTTSATEVLSQCIEPPNMDTIQRSFDSLYRWKYITEPNDEHGQITKLGKFVTILGIDLTLGCLIGLGIQFGLTAEVIELASILSFPKTPFSIANPLLQDPVTYNEIQKSTYISNCHFDSNLYSYPLSIMNLLWDYNMATNKHSFCKYYRLAHARMNQLLSTRKSLKARVANFLGIDDVKLQLQTPPVHMPYSKIVLLRVLQVWVFSDTLIECKPTTKLLPKGGSQQDYHTDENNASPLTLPLKVSGDVVLKDSHFKQVLDRDRHPFTLVSQRHIEQRGEFEYSLSGHAGSNYDYYYPHDPHDSIGEDFFPNFMVDFEERLLSFVIEKDEVDLVWCFDDNELSLYFLCCPEYNHKHEVEREKQEDTNVNKEEHKFLFFDRLSSTLISNWDAKLSTLIAEERLAAKRRGIFERKCGAWSIASQQNRNNGDLPSEHRSSIAATRNTNRDSGVFRSIQKLHIIVPKGLEHSVRDLHSTLMGIAVSNTEVVKAVLSWDFTSPRKKKKKSKSTVHGDVPTQFLVTGRGVCSEVAKIDLKDLLGGGSNVAVTTVKDDVSQSICFMPSPNKPMPYSGKDGDKLATPYVSDDCSWKLPMFADIPEGARLLSVLATGQRRSAHAVRVVDTPNGDIRNQKEKKKRRNGSDAEDGGEVAIIEVQLDKEVTNITQRWKRLGTDLAVFVPEYTVPASATSLSQTLFACCSNALEVKGGGIRVEGLTVLPPNPMFLLLSLMTFGLLPNISILELFKNSSTDCGEDEDTVVRKGMKWLMNRVEKPKGKGRHHSTDAYYATRSYDHVDNENSRITEDAIQQLQMAVEFHKSCFDMGEELICFPDKIQVLCKIFDSIDSNKVSPWDSLEETSLTKSNLRQWTYEHRTRKEQPEKPAVGSDKKKVYPKLPGHKGHEDSAVLEHLSQLLGKVSVDASVPSSSSTSALQSPSLHSEGISLSTSEERSKLPHRSVNDRFLRGVLLNSYPASIISVSRRLFATELDHGESVDPNSLVSTNILSLLVKVYCDLLLEKEGVENNDYILKKQMVRLDHDSWEVLRYETSNGKMWYQAKFINGVIPLLPVFGRGKNKVPKWMKKHSRPSSVEDAAACVPANVNLPTPITARVAKDGRAVLFESIEDAISMEAAFWLERQFCSAGKTWTRHWYDFTFPQMIQILSTHIAANG